MKGSNDLRARLLDEVMEMRAVDVHSHVPAGAPFACSLRELLGYHYYTELAHSAGMDGSVVAEERSDEEMIPALIEAMGAIDNTVQHSWMMELARTLFGFEQPKLTPQNWQGLADAVRRAAERPARAREILDASRLERVFLTNEFDDDLGDVDAQMFVPSLRADALVFRLCEPEVRERLERAAGVSVDGAAGLRRAVAVVAERFLRHGARSAAVSLPPGFSAARVLESQFDAAVRKAASGAALDGGEETALQAGALFAVAEACNDLSLPFQIMCGALRGAYAHAVPQGSDLPQAGDTLRGLLPLLNAFPGVTFCLSILSDSQVQELTSYGWIVQNVVLSGHWWYTNVPAYIARELTARLQCVPKTKQIGYYSDMYKLEFGLPKFNMYRRVLARVLADEMVEPGLATEQEAVQLSRLLLVENPKRIFDL